MKIFSSFLLCLFGTITGCPLFAKEPVNLSACKQEVIRYYDSGQYHQDMNDVIQQAIAYLKQKEHQPLPKGKKPAIVLDIDETALSNYPDMLKRRFGGTDQDHATDKDAGTNPVIMPTLTLYDYAKAHHVAVFFITSRHENERDITAKNLHEAGYNNWDGLTLRFGRYNHASVATYKTAMRQRLNKQGYEILENIGDQESDLTGGFADKTFKLPNPFYSIPLQSPLGFVA
ncbi:MAG: hypothetical protein A3E85_04530 [Gammaproteobacteria bacterium RIFCSPHIGHO2_12_FULL_45_12]|nr:MAG: hypothetical protein A3E85_04530 [Gammaproteobacteria bacterium RIFCSPHIGHO2_12_FULL_45_12]